MQISYNKLWKVLIDNGMTSAELRKRADFAPNTLTKLKQNQPVALTLLLKICEVLDTDIGNIMSFVPGNGTTIRQTQDNILEYSNISMALSIDFNYVYYINLGTDEYVEYKSKDNKEMKFTYDGIDFFRDFESSIIKSVHKEDRNEVLSFFEKSHLLNGLRSSSVLTITYRMLEDSAYNYFRAKAILSPSNGVDYLVIGISNVDSAVKRELEQTNALNSALQMANKDPLTNVGNSNAYKQAEKQYNAMIANGEIRDFSIVFCDVNDLKVTNDSLGHAAGDALIKYVSNTICSSFKHSPVFRIGGDEFVVFLSGEDFDKKDTIFKNLRLLNKKQALAGKNVFSCGMATYNPETDFSVSSVLERADSMMYYNKRELKAIQSATN